MLCGPIILKREMLEIENKSFVHTTKISFFLINYFLNQSMNLKRAIFFKENSRKEKEKKIFFLLCRDAKK